MLIIYFSIALVNLKTIFSYSIYYPWRPSQNSQKVDEG